MPTRAHSTAYDVRTAPVPAFAAILIRIRQPSARWFLRRLTAYAGRVLEARLFGPQHLPPTPDVGVRVRRLSKVEWGNERKKKGKGREGKEREWEAGQAITLTLRPLGNVSLPPYQSPLLLPNCSDEPDTGPPRNVSAQCGVGSAIFCNYRLKHIYKKGIQEKRGNVPVARCKECWQSGKVSRRRFCTMVIRNEEISQRSLSILKKPKVARCAKICIIDVHLICDWCADY
ncbi:hypothetical protein BDQ17DRAFT_1513400 [Cyathus striatus]|nr:hypothetical protein BDQ17DRAFT_1513400 [Cyathus striatus]